MARSACRACRSCSSGPYSTASLTWWEQSKPWHEYVARCQHMLRQGRFVADVCFVAPRAARTDSWRRFPIRGAIPDRPEYNFDGCPAELVLHGMTVRDGCVVLPCGNAAIVCWSCRPTTPMAGRSWHVEGNYVYTDSPLPKVQTMTPQLLQADQGLVEAGATVLGTRPLKSPSLAGFPECDRELARLADELWGENAGSRRERPAPRRQGARGLGSYAGEGPGRHERAAGLLLRAVAQGQAALYAPPHGRWPGTLLRGQQGRWRGAGSMRLPRGAGQPELWWPQTGRTEPIAEYERTEGVTRVPLRLEPQESVFVVFRPGREVFDPVISVICDGPERFVPTAGSVENSS